MPAFDMPGYATPMDRAYHENLQANHTRPQYKLEDPIAPISRIGQTVPERDQFHGGMIQGVQAAIRGGAGAIQVVLQQPHTQWSPEGGRISGFGHEFRTALREVIKANEVMFAGVEMPVSSLTNLSGFDGRSGLSEKTREENLSEIQKAIEFVADVGQGGGVDAVAFEFPRAKIGWEATQSWNPTVKEKGRSRPLFYDHDYDAETRTESIWLVNQETGKIAPLNIGEGVEIARDPKTGEVTKDGAPIRWNWEQLMGYARKVGKHPGEIIKEDILKRQQTIQERELARAEIRADDAKRMFEEKKEYYEGIPSALTKVDRDIGQMNQALQQVEAQRRSANDAQKQQLDQFKQQLQAQLREATDAREKLTEDKERLGPRLDLLNKQVQAEAAAIPELRAQIAKQRQDLENLKPFDEIAKDNTADSYAQAGIYAMGETAKRHLKKAITVGPENGWPDLYGGHPDEFIEIIQSARKKMADALIADGIVKDKSKAMEEAKRHIRGTFDTSHMGMWLKHFHPPKKEGERPEAYEARRRSEFDKWYLEQADKIAKADVIANIQLVDSRHGEHGHLPAGEGTLPLQDAAKLFKKRGFAGPWISEGHEEEKYGLGKIRTSAWKTLGATYSGGYTPGGPPAQRWGDVYNTYMSKTYSPKMMFGAYAPSAEFRMWSEVPLE